MIKTALKEKKNQRNKKDEKRPEVNKKQQTLRVEKIQIK